MLAKLREISLTRKFILKSFFIHILASITLALAASVFFVFFFDKKSFAAIGLKEYFLGLYYYWGMGVLCSNHLFWISVFGAVSASAAAAVLKPKKVTFILAHAMYAFLAYGPIIGSITQIIRYCGE